MSRILTFRWRNPANAVHRRIPIGFAVKTIRSIDLSNGNSWYWTDVMNLNTALQTSDGSIVASNGFSLFNDEINLFGAPLAALSRANPGVFTITHNSGNRFGFTVGDTVVASGIVHQSNREKDPNMSYTIATVSADGTAITTDTDTRAVSTYVSGGVLIRVRTVDGNIIPVANYAERGVILGTGVVGGNNAEISCTVMGD